MALKDEDPTWVQRGYRMGLEVIERTSWGEDIVFGDIRTVLQPVIGEPKDSGSWSSLAMKIWSAAIRNKAVRETDRGKNSSFAKMHHGRWAKVFVRL